MHKRHQYLFSAALSALSLLTMNVAAAEHGDRCEYRPHAHGRMEAGHGFGAMHRGLQRKLESLDLSSAQQDQVKQILDKQKPAREAKRQELHEAFKALRAASTSDSYDIRQVQEIANRQARIQADLTVMRTDTRHQIYSLLTPEQKKKWQAAPARPAPSEKS